jgi:hypothetical protein
MKKIDAFEKEILDAYEKGEFKSTSPAQENLAKFKAAASDPNYSFSINVGVLFIKRKVF